MDLPISLDFVTIWVMPAVSMESLALAATAAAQGTQKALTQGWRKNWRVKYDSRVLFTLQQTQKAQCKKTDIEKIIIIKVKI